MKPFVFAFSLFSVAAYASPVETYLEATGPLGSLKGTILRADGNHLPIVLIVPGSGPTDRDGNSPLGVKASTYKLLAEGLAQRGITSVRIDKRGMFASVGAVRDGNGVTIADYVADVRSWTEAIRKNSGTSCVWVLGHSEGALVALAAAESVQNICGLVLVSASGRPAGELLRQQLQANSANAPILDQALGAIDALEAGRSVDITNFNPALRRLFYPPVQGFLISAFSYDPAKLIGTYSGPVLILQGQRDIQVSPDDAQLLARADPHAKLVLVPDANHVLKQVGSDSRVANLATYSDPSLPLAPGVVSPIADFILSSKPKH
jgi:pimeloyl-ACP methyl ester carboxylesterase